VSVSSDITPRPLWPTDSEDGDIFHFEKLFANRGFTQIAGVDEVGRGPLAGPVVAAAVILPPSAGRRIFPDSKQISTIKRLELFDALRALDLPAGIGVVSPAQIDRWNIHQASLLAMGLAVAGLCRSGAAVDCILVDGKFSLPILIAQQPLIGGDRRSATIGAASIIAKITRDAVMSSLHHQFPAYGFAEHKGYPTAFHRAALAVHGPSPVHRKTFKGVCVDV
jgi:ribonuclease HII